MVDQPWDGVTERRKADQKFDRAMVDVRALKEGVTGLAEAFRIRTDTLDRLMKQIALMFVVLFILQFLVGLWFVGGLKARIEDTHAEILCQLELTPEAKALLGDKACR